MSTRRPGTLRWAAPEQISLKIRKRHRSGRPKVTYILSGTSLFRQAISYNPSSALSLLQVFSGNNRGLKFDEMPLSLYSWPEGQKPGRPQSRPMDDQYWEFIERCWSEVQERPSAEDIVSALQHFRASLPLSPSLGDYLRSSAGPTASQLTSSGSSLSFIVTAVDDNTSDVGDTFNCSLGPHGPLRLQRRSYPRLFASQPRWHVFWSLPTRCELPFIASS
jgi:hypothetical protein